MPKPSRRRGARAACALAACLAAGLAATSCASLGRRYLDNIERTYPSSRAFAARMRPATRVKVSSCEDIELPGPAGPIPARLYAPLELRAEAPLLLYMHGGGFATGSYRKVDRVARSLASGGRCFVLSIDYALAPERPYPAGLADCEAAFEWLEARAAGFGSAPERIVVAGESAGGNLSAALAQKRRDEGRSPPLAQMLFSPTLGGLDPDTGEPWPSWRENASKGLLSPRSMGAFAALYLGDPADYARDPYVNPIMAGSFAGLPRALVVTCGRDLLRDEGEAYARKLREAGVEVTARRFEGKDHAYLGKEVMALAAEFLGSL